MGSAAQNLDFRGFMKRFVVYPDSMMSEMKQVLIRKEPVYLHLILWIIIMLVFVIALFVSFGKIDDVVKAEGLVRPVTNVSIVNNIVSGEIDLLFYKPGDFVHAGDKLLSVKGDGYFAKKDTILYQLKDINEKIKGLEAVLKSYLNNSDAVEGAGDTIKSRYEAFSSEKRLLNTKVERALKLLNEEKMFPDSLLTESSVESRKYEYSLALMEFEDFCADFYSSIKQEIDLLKIEKSDYLSQLTQIEEIIKNLVLFSPIDGYVQEKSSLNPGDYIQKDQSVLNIIPVTEENCRIELHIPAESMGKLKIGQKVKLRFPAFPYSEFRGLDGKLCVIQPDSEITDMGRVYFKVFATSDSLYLKDKKGCQYQIKPGFTVNARIVLERETLLYFLLKKLDFTV